MALAKTTPDLAPFLVWAFVAFFCGAALLAEGSRLARAARSRLIPGWWAIAALPLLALSFWSFTLACLAFGHYDTDQPIPVYLPPGQSSWLNPLGASDPQDLIVCQVLGWATLALTMLLVVLCEWLASRPRRRPCSLAQPARPDHEQFLQRALLPLEIGKPQPASQEWQSAEQTAGSASFTVYHTALSAPAWPDEA